MKQNLKKLFILLAVAVLMLTTISCNKDDKKDDTKKADLTIEQRVMESVTANHGAKQMHVLANISMELDDDFLVELLPDTGMNKELFELISNIDISAEVKTVMDDPDHVVDYFMSYDVNYKSQPLLTLDVYFNDESVEFAISNFYPKTFALNFEELMALSMMEIDLDQTLTEIDFVKYTEIVQDIDASDIDTDAYIALIEAHLKDVLTDEGTETLEYTYEDESFETEVTVVTYSLDLESMMTLFSDFIEMAEDDDALRNYAEEVILEVVEEFVDSKDYESFDLLEEDMTNATEEMEENFSDYWDDMFDELDDSMDLAMDSLEDPDEDMEEIMDVFTDNIDIKLYLDKNNNIKKTAVEVEAEGIKFNYDIIVHATEDVTINRPEDSINIIDLVEEKGDFATEEGRNQLMIDVISSAISTLNDAEGYQTLLADLEPFEDLLGVSISELEMGLGMLELMVEGMSYDDLIEMLDFGGGDDYDDFYDDDDTGYVTNDLNLIAAVITDSGNIYDGGFNESAYDGLMMAQNMYGIEIDSFVPAGQTTDDLLAAYADAINMGYNTIVAPGFMHEVAVYQAQDLYPEVKFIILDGSPHNEDYTEFRQENNVVSIFFNEAEASFFAGVASALQTTSGQIGFVGGMEIPAVQKFGWGYVAGVAYANYMYGSNAHVTDYVYQGTFHQVEKGQEIAAAMYESGIDTIHAAAGGVGIGVLNETIARNEKGDYVFFVGVDIDQYSDGYTSEGNSVVLTSAMKNLNNAVYMIFEALAKDEFPGGQTLMLGAKEGGVSLPSFNMNLTFDTDDAILEVLNAISEGNLIVPTSLEELTSFLTEVEYVTPDGLNY